MKSFIVILLTTMAFISCNKKVEEQKKEYVVAYNVFAPDSTAPNNYEVMIVSTSGSNRTNLNIT